MLLLHALFPCTLLQLSKILEKVIFRRQQEGQQYPSHTTKPMPLEKGEKNKEAEKRSWQRTAEQLSRVRTEISLSQCAASTSGRTRLIPLSSQLFSAHGLHEIDMVSLYLVTFFGFCFRELTCCPHVNIDNPNTLQQGVPRRNRTNDTSFDLLGACYLYLMLPCSYIGRDSEQLTSLQVSHYFVHL